MSKRLLVAGLLSCACGRTERTNGASVPAHGAPSAPASIASAVRLPERSAAPSAAAAFARPPGSILSAAAVGYTSGLRLEAGALTYCDDRGGRALDLDTALEGARERPCDKHEERNPSCDGIEVVDQVREPGPDEDIIDLKNGLSQAAHGHVTDCAFSNGTLLVATWNEIVAIDIKADRREVKSKVGGPQVAINGDWIAWSDGKKVFAQRR